MGIRVKHPVSALSEEAFHRLDYQVMSMAFDLYNSIGNLWDEADYKSKLYDCCVAAGLEAKSEAQVTASYKAFQKQYFIDLLIEGTVYELKTTSGIACSNESQTLNYLFLTDTRHAKIINFRPDLLECRFISTTLSKAQRRSYFLNTDKWTADHQTVVHLPDLLSELLDDWGAYLDIQLYKEAVLFFINLPPENLHKRFCPLNSEILLHFTGLARKKAAYQKNLQKYLNNSTYQEINWINFDQNNIECHTLRKNNSATK